LSIKHRLGSPDGADNEGSLTDFALHTYNLDLDLNGLVDADDYSRLDIGFATGAIGPQNGDIDLNDVQMGRHLAKVCDTNGSCLRNPAA
jgi:hypothetical protein